MDLYPFTLEKWLNECQPKSMAHYMNNSKNYETYFEIFCSANIEINLSQDGEKSSK